MLDKIIRRGGTITNCYNIGSINCSYAYTSDGLYGAICTREYSNNMNVTNTYYLDTISNPSGIGTSKTSDELKSMATNLGTAFKEDTNNVNGGYPILSWE